MSRSKKKSFPVKITVGGTYAKIYKQATHSGTVFVVAWYLADRRKRKSFSCFDRAKFHAEKVCRQISRGEALATSLTSRDVVAYSRAVEALEGTGLELDQVAKDYATAHDRLNGVSVQRAIDFYLKSHPTDIQPRTVQAVYEEFLAYKHEEQLSARYIEDVKSRCGRFAKAFQTSICNITNNDILAFLKGLKLKPRNRNNYIGSIRTLFNFAIENDYLPRDFREHLKLKKAKVNSKFSTFTVPRGMKDRSTDCR